MRINLIRNLNTKKDKNQELFFENALNFDLFFDVNKKIVGIDEWKFSNVKKIVNLLIDSRNLNLKIEFEFSKWNQNVSFILSFAHANLINLNELTQDEIKPFLLKDLYKMHNFILEIQSDKNKQMGLLLFLSRHLKSNEVALKVVDLVVNKGISQIDTAISILFPLFLKEK